MKIVNTIKEVREANKGMEKRRLNSWISSNYGIFT